MKHQDTDNQQEVELQEDIKITINEVEYTLIEDESKFYVEVEEGREKVKKEVRKDRKDIWYFVEEPKKEKNAVKKIVIGLAIIIALLLLLMKCTGDRGTKDVDEKPKLEYEIDANSEEGRRKQKEKEEIEAELNQKVAEGMLNISMNLSPIFETGTSKGNLLIVNDEINHYGQIVEIYRDDTGEMIYKTGLIPVGSRIDEAQLDVDLEAGEYECTAYFNAVDLESQSIVGKTGAKIILKVLK